MSDRIFAGIWLALCIGGLFVAWQIQSEYTYEPVGPRPFPMAIVGLMALCAVFLLFRRPDVVSWPHHRVLQRLLVMIAGLVLYAWGFEWLGFPLATALLTVCIAMQFGASWRAAIVTGLVMGGALYFAFDRLLDVTLPVGYWLS